MRLPKISVAVVSTCLLAYVSAADPVSAAIRPFIEHNEISGAVTLVAENGELKSFEATGLADIANNTPMRRDTVFWVASMTKPLAGVAIMMLAEEGLLNVDDLVEEHLAEFGDVWMVAERSDDSMTLKRPARKITIKDLLTHTAGLPNVPIPRSTSTLGELVAMSGRSPVQFEPGSRWQYSNAGIDALGRIVEVISGMPYDAFLKERVFAPLKMRNTSFHPTRRQARRLAKSYQKNRENNELEETDIYFVKSDLWDTTRTVRPAGGLFSTAEDMFRFYQMMLNGGEWKGRRLIAEDSVRELTRTQTGEIKTGFTAGMSWGLAFQVVKEPQGVTGMLSPGTFGHGGAYATQSWADPGKGAIFILMVQRRGLPNGDDSAFRKAFQQAAVDTLSK
jgi:CubicO group peptidase (beta-lactamase class C family)